LAACCGAGCSEHWTWQFAERGGNAVTGVRYDATELMQGVTEVLAFGTAVVVERE
jgi:uncharacterized protein YbjQ (UPF0145 family)